MSQTPSVASHMIVESYIKTLNQSGKFAYLSRRGDGDRGLITIIFDHLDDTATAYSQVRDFISGELSLKCIHDSPISTADMKQWVNKQMAFDGDMWVVDVECAERDIESALEMFPFV